MARVTHNKNTVQGYKRGHVARTRRYIKDTGKRYNARAVQLHKRYRYKCEQGKQVHDPYGPGEALYKPSEALYERGTSTIPTRASMFSARDTQANCARGRANKAHLPAFG